MFPSKVLLWTENNFPAGRNLPAVINRRFSPAANSHFRLTKNSCCFCLHSLGTNGTENIVSNNSSFITCLFATAETCCCAVAYQWMPFLDPLFRLSSIMSQYPFVSPICSALQPPSLLLDDCNRVIVVKSLCFYSCLVAWNTLMHEAITIRENDGNT